MPQRASSPGMDGQKSSASVGENSEDTFTGPYPLLFQESPQLPPVKKIKPSKSYSSKATKKQLEKKQQAEEYALGEVKAIAAWKKEYDEIIKYELKYS